MLTALPNKIIFLQKSLRNGKEGVTSIYIIAISQEASNERFLRKYLAHLNRQDYHITYLLTPDYVIISGMLSLSSANENPLLLPFELILGCVRDTASGDDASRTE